MLDQERCHAGALAVLDHHRDELVGLRGAEPGGRLVEHQQLWAGHERTRDLDAAAVCMGEFARGALC